MQFFVVFLILFNVALGASEEKVATNALRDQARNERKCKSLYPNSKEYPNQISTGNYFESIKYFDCVIEYANISINSKPKTASDYRKNAVLNEKIVEYKQKRAAIENNVEEGASNLTKSSEERIFEKEIVIKKAENTQVTIERKPETLEQAKQKCENKGFKEKAFDSLEAYLFEKCLAEEGFIYTAPKNLGTVPASIKLEREEKNKVKKEKKIETKQKKDETKRQKILEKKQIKQEPISQNQNITKQEPVLQKEVQQPKITNIEPAQEIRQTNMEPEEKVIIKTEVKPSGNNKDVTYTKKTVCKIDPNGGKVCNYDSRYKVQGTNPVNKI